MKSSEKLSKVLELTREVENQYDFSVGRISDLECLQNDLLHKLEFKASTAAERSKIATALKKCRNERRRQKEQTELLRELVEFISANQSQVKKLEKILGNMRKNEENQEKRTYKPRVLTVEEWERS